MVYLYIFIGAGTGALLRYFLQQWLNTDGFPLGTLGVNIIGSLFIGLVMAGILRGDSSSASQFGLVLTVGVLGGFTTFSTFSFEAMELISSGAIKTAFIYMGLSLIGGLAFCYVGYHAGRLITP